MKLVTYGELKRLAEKVVVICFRKHNMCILAWKLSANYVCWNWLYAKQNPLYCHLNHFAFMLEWEWYHAKHTTEINGLDNLECFFCVFYWRKYKIFKSSMLNLLVALHRYGDKYLCVENNAGNLICFLCLSHNIHKWSSNNILYISIIYVF